MRIASSVASEYIITQPAFTRDHWKDQ